MRCSSASSRLVRIVTPRTSVESLRARAKHRLAAGRMHRHHRRAERRRLGHRVLRRVRDVVNLQIEENLRAAIDHLAHDRRTVRDEGLQTDLQHAGRAVQRIGEAEDLVARGAIDGDNQSVSCLHIRHDSDRMNKFDIARALDDISSYLELSENNRFRALAFERAAHSIRALDAEPADLIASGELVKTPGIGKATAAIIEELVRTGESKYLDELRAQYPAGIFELLRVPKLGLKKIGILHEKLGVGNLDELEKPPRAKGASRRCRDSARRRSSTSSAASRKRGAASRTFCCRSASKSANRFASTSPPSRRSRTPRSRGACGGGWRSSAT